MYGKAAAIIDHERGNMHPIGQMRLNTGFARAVNESAITLSKDITSQSAANQDILADTDALITTPWQKSLAQRILNKINAGTPGEAFDLLLEKLEKHDPDSIETVLNTVFDRLDSETTNTWAAQYFAAELGSFLSFNDMGLDIEFFNTGPNSIGSVPEPDVRINRHAIERHFTDERHKSPEHVQPFLGVSYGP